MDTGVRSARARKRFGWRGLAAPAATALVVVLLTGCTGRVGSQPAADPTQSVGTTPVAISTVTPSATTPPKAGVLIRIIPDRVAAKAGEQIPATVRLENTTGHVVEFAAHACSGNILPGIASDRIPLTAVWAAVACAPWSLPVSGIVYRVELSTSYQECGTPLGSNVNPSTMPPCGPGGPMPALPPGTYRTDAVWVGIAASVAVVDPVAITLTR